MSFASSIGPDSRPRTTPIRSASITRLSFSWPMRASAASAFRFERKKKKGPGTRARTRWRRWRRSTSRGRASGESTADSPRSPSCTRRAATAGSRAPSVAGSQSSGPNSRSATAAIAKNGKMPPEGSVNRSAPANTQMFALMIISSRPARCAPLAFSASTPTKPATNPSSTGRVARFPNDASTYDHTNMMTAPTNALMLQSRMRFCVSTRWASLVPSRRIRSSSRRAGARHSSQPVRAKAPRQRRASDRAPHPLAKMALHLRRDLVERLLLDVAQAHHQKTPPVVK